MQAKGQEKGLQLHTATQLPSCQKFCLFMEELRAGATFSEQIAVIWAIEKAYNEVRPCLLEAVAAEMLLPCASAQCGHASFCMCHPRFAAGMDSGLCAACISGIC